MAAAGARRSRHKTVDEAQSSLLDNLASASVYGLVATGPRRGCRVLRLGAAGEDAEAVIPGKRYAEVAAFHVHANTCARANDRERLEEHSWSPPRPHRAGA
jgi:hypothetical protein